MEWSENEKLDCLSYCYCFFWGEIDRSILDCLVAGDMDLVNAGDLDEFEVDFIWGFDFSCYLGVCSYCRLFF